MVGKLIILFITIISLIVFFKNKERINKNLEEFSFYTILKQTFLTTIEQGNISIDQIKDNYLRSVIKENNRKIEENNRKKIQVQKYQNLQFRREKFGEVKTKGRIVFSSINYPFFYDVILNYDDFYQSYTCRLTNQRGGSYVNFMRFNDISLLGDIYSAKDLNLNTKYPFVVRLKFKETQIPDGIEYRSDDGPIKIYDPIYYEKGSYSGESKLSLYDPDNYKVWGTYKLFYVVLPLEFFKDTKKIVMRINDKQIKFDSNSIFDFIFSYGFCKNANYEL